MSESARERILEAACDLVAEEGIDNVRIARVAMRARASTALVHHYFSTREELLEQALLHSFEVVAGERFVEPEGSRRPAAATLALAIEECLPVPGRLERDWVLWVELWLRAVREPELRPVAQTLYRRYHRWFSGTIAAGVESGEFTAPADLDVLTDRAMALLDGLGLRALLRDPTMGIEDARRQVADLLAPELGIEAAELLAPDP